MRTFDRRAASSTFRLTIAALAVLSLRCAASLPPASARTVGPLAETAARPPLRVASKRRLVIVHAHVNKERRIVASGDSATRIEPKIGACAREISRAGLLEPGTRVRAIYALDGNATGEGASRSLVAVEIGSGSAARRVIYPRGDVDGGCYAETGLALGRMFLRYPLAFVAVTSAFNPARQHPVLGRQKPHLGVDFAAKRGTPVLAVADGEIVEIGWSNGFGRNIRIQHADGFVSGYAHLDRFGPLVIRQGRVRKGEVIGYVGTTGMTTGPHLHFTLARNGRFLDPLSVALPEHEAARPDLSAVVRGLATESDLALARINSDDNLVVRIAALSPYR